MLEPLECLIGYFADAFCILFGAYPKTLAVCLGITTAAPVQLVLQLRALMSFSFTCSIRSMNGTSPFHTFFPRIR